MIQELHLWRSRIWIRVQKREIGKGGVSISGVLRYTSPKYVSMALF
jgi:hypothetical protein